MITGETGTRLAVELMSSVACGVGAGLPHRVGFRFVFLMFFVLHLCALTGTALLFVEFPNLA